jgi:hypothetical protein
LQLQQLRPLRFLQKTQVNYLCLHPPQQQQQQHQLLQEETAETLALVLASVLEVPKPLQLSAF